LARHISLPPFMSTKRSKAITVAVAGALTVAAAVSVATTAFPSSPAPTPAVADAFLTTISQQAAATHVAAQVTQPAAANGGPQALKLRVYQSRQQFADQQAAAAKAPARKATTGAKQAAHQAPAQQAQPAQVAAVTTPSGSPEQIAEQMLSQFGWSASQFSCLQPLWQQESGWNVTAENPSSGAYGIPQALPGSEMASAGADWQSDATTQIRWGLTYIQGRYGSPCGAWAHEQADGWY
jgi:hypothetical protein